MQRKILFLTSFFIFIAVSAVFLLRHEAETNTTAIQKVAVVNASPVIQTLYTSSVAVGEDESFVSVYEGIARTVFVYGTAYDPNGCSDFLNGGYGVAKLYRSNVIGGPNCEVDYNNCYQAYTYSFIGCDASNVSGQVSFKFLVPIYFYADATDVGTAFESTNWTAHVTIFDSQGAQTSRSDYFELMSMVAVEVSDDISFGALKVGDFSADVPFPFINYGNTEIDVRLIATNDFICKPSGIKIPVENMHIGDHPYFDYHTQGIEITDTIAKELELSLLPQTNDMVASSRMYYFKLKVPETAPSGICTTILEVTAKSAD